MAHTSQLSRAQTRRGLAEARAERKIRDINPNHGSPEFSPREENKENRTTCDPRPNIALTGSVPTTSLALAGTVRRY